MSRVVNTPSQRIEIKGGKRVTWHVSEMYNEVVSIIPIALLAKYYIILFFYKHREETKEKFLKSPRVHKQLSAILVWK